MKRTFLAVELGAEILERHAAFHARVRREAPGPRWVRPENLHLTLRFLGDTGEGQIGAIRRETEAAISDLGPFRATIGAPGCFGRRSAPRTLWFGLEEGAAALEKLVARLEAAATRLGFKAEERAWSPHLTVARNSRQAPVEAWEDLLRGSGLPGLSFPVAEVLLIESQTSPPGGREGPVYTSIFRAPLPAITPARTTDR